MDNIPLDRRINSWVVIKRSTDEVMFETYNREIIRSINTAKYLVLTSYQYLALINHKIKEGNGNG